MVAGALLEKNGDAVAGVPNAASKLLELGFQELVIGAFRHVNNARLQSSEAAGDRVRDKLDIAHAELTAFTEIRSRFYRAEEFVHIFNELGGESHPGGVAHHREQTFS